MCAAGYAMASLLGSRMFFTPLVRRQSFPVVAQVEVDLQLMLLTVAQAEAPGRIRLSWRLERGLGADLAILVDRASCAAAGVLQVLPGCNAMRIGLL